MLPHLANDARVDFESIITGGASATLYTLHTYIMCAVHFPNTLDKIEPHAEIIHIHLITT